MSGSVSAWSDYWSEGRGSGCLAGAPPELRNRLEAVWQELARTLADGASVLDIAAGDGAVFRAMRSVRGDLVMKGVDSAVVGDGAAGMDITGGIDASELPFVDGRFDAVVSQFGLEYCPPRAVAEAVRVAAPGAVMTLLCHHADSIAVAHNARRAAAMTAMIKAGLLALARRAACGAGEDQETVAAITRARQAYSDQSIVAELPMALGQALAGRRPAEMVERIAARLSSEIDRLTAMQAAALNDAGAQRLAAQFDALGVCCSARPVVLDNGDRIAWELKGRRR